MMRLSTQQSCRKHKRHRWSIALLSVALLAAMQAALARRALVTDSPWPAMLAKAKSARASALYKFTDYDVPRDPSIRTRCLGARFCECQISGGYNQSFWLNTAAAVHNGQPYVVILQRTLAIDTDYILYSQDNTTVQKQIFEANSLLFCKAQLKDKLSVKREDCKLVEPGPGYREKHPYAPRGHLFELNGLIDPRLISTGEGGLFLQAGCRPWHLEMTYNITKFKEGLCVVKLMDGVRNQGSDQAAPQPEPLLPGVTIASADWPTGKLMSITHASGVGPWEKSWVPFSYKGTVLFSRTLSPHQVVTVHANGIASTLYKTENADVFRHLDHVCGTGPRGNAAAWLLSPSESGLPRPVYLSILHYTPHRNSAPHPNDRQCKEYLNFFYLMDAEPPFHILEVSRSPIPLLSATNPVLDSPPLEWGMGYISFPTGMVVIDGQVIITYGSGDTQLRVFHASLSDVLTTFTHTYLHTPPNSTLVQGELPGAEAAEQA